VRAIADRADTGAADTGAAGAGSSAGQCVVRNEGRADQRGGRETYHDMAQHQHGVSFPVTCLIATAAPCIRVGSLSSRCGEQSSPVETPDGFGSVVPAWAQRGLPS
jgi:hypothetical protein